MDIPKHRSLPKYLFLAEMSPGLNEFETFDATYDDHLAQLTRVPGVTAAARVWSQGGEVFIGGEVHRLSAKGAPRHVALYAMDDSDVLLSREWRRAVDEGAWAEATRAQTSGREHRILRVASWWTAGRKVVDFKSDGSGQPD